MKRSIETLFATLFDAQEDDLDTPVHPADYWRAAIEGERKLSYEDAILLTTSPINRQVYDRVYHQCLMRFVRGAANTNSRPTLRAAAASGGRRMEFTFNGLEHFELLVMRTRGDRWTVRLRILQRGFPTAVTIRVLDGSGAEWLSGVPDEDGEIYGNWTLDTPPEDYISGDTIPLLTADGIRIALTPDHEEDTR